MRWCKVSGFLSPVIIPPSGSCCASAVASVCPSKTVLPSCVSVSLVGASHFSWQYSLSTSLTVVVGNHSDEASWSLPAHLLPMRQKRGCVCILFLKKWMTCLYDKWWNIQEIRLVCCCRIPSTLNVILSEPKAIRRIQEQLIAYTS